MHAPRAWKAWSLVLKDVRLLLVTLSEGSSGFAAACGFYLRP